MQNTQQVIQIERTRHRGEQRLKLIFSYDPELIKQVRKIPDCRWSATMKCWHVPDSTRVLTALKEVQQRSTDLSLLSSACCENS